ELLEDLGRNRRERLDPDLAHRHVAAEALAPLAQVADLRAVFARPVERRLADLRIGDRNPEARAERPQLVFVHLLLLMRDVLAFAGFTKAVALDGAREDDGGSALVLDRRLVGVVDLDRVVPAESHLLQL